MAKLNFLSWDTTANNNTDVGNININEGCAPSGINNAIREIMAQLRADIDGEMVYATKAVNYTALANDNNAVIECTAALTLTLTAVATLGANWHIWVYANGGDVTIDPNASELINGATTLVIPNGSSALVISTGSAFRAIVTRGAPPYSVKTGAYTALSADNGGVIRFTTAATLSLTAAATLGSGWRLKVIAYGVDVTIDPNASEQINGAATFILKSGQTADIVCDGSAFWADVHGDTLSGPQLRGLITGLAITNNGADATNDLDIAVGSAASDTSPFYLMQLGSAITKRIDANWAVGTNQGGLDTGAVGNGIYYEWEIQRSDTGVTDALISLSSTAPTMPANYDRKALIGKMARTAGVNNAPRSYSQKGPTPWVAYTPTFTGFGVVTGISMFSRQNGENIEIMGRFTVGTPTAVEARMSLGFNGTDSNIVSDATLVPSIRSCGLATYDNVLSGTQVPMVLIESNVGYLTFGLQSGAFAGLTKRNGNVFASTGWAVSLNAILPISGW
jgi:hypothetical protein